MKLKYNYVKELKEVLERHRSELETEACHLPDDVSDTFVEPVITELSKSIDALFAALYQTEVYLGER